MKKLILGFAVLSLAIPCQARIITVDDDGPADFSTIQAAINDANNGDTIIVNPGIYDYINFLGKNIVLTSTNPNDWNVVRETSIGNPNFEPPWGGVIFDGREDPNCKITGFNIEYIIYGNHTHATISHCLLVENVTDDGRVINACDGTISNCVISKPFYFIPEGASVIYQCRAFIKNCTIAQTCPLGTIFLNLSGGTCTIENSIIYDNDDSHLPIGIGQDSTVNISYSNIKNSEKVIEGSSTVSWGLNWGPGNIDIDPCFVELAHYGPGGQWVSGDYHLKSQAGRWDVKEAGWTMDEVTSPCIDAGNPGCPIGDEPTPNGNRINMGAYGGTAEASKSPSNWHSIADLTNDWIVDFNDLKVFFNDWLETGQCIPSDLDRSKSVDFNDFAIFADNWLWP